MEFVTLHQLSVELDTSVRVLRHRLRQLLETKKLTENQDCRREEFVDATHFVWKINREAFIRATGLQPVTKAATIVQSMGSNSDNQSPSPHSPVADKHDATLPNIDTKPGGIERELINLLKDQILVKDRQIEKLNDLNVKLVGQSVHQLQQIEALLRLTGGEAELREGVIVAGNPSDAANGPPAVTDAGRAA